MIIVRLLLAALAVAAVSPCLARTHTVRSTQQLPDPGESYQQFGLQVAIDADSIIALADRDGGRSALLYRRGSNGQWTLSRVLLDVTAPPESLRASLVMKNGIAAVQLDGTLHVYQRAGADWAEALLPVEAQHPGGSLAISARRIAVGLSACKDDTLLLTEAASGSWVVTGRVTGPDTPCTSHPVTLDLYNYALVIRRNATEVHLYTLSTGQVEWAHLNTFTLPADAASAFGPVVVQRQVMVAPGSSVLRGDGALFYPSAPVVPVDHANGSGFARQVVFRDGVLLSMENWGEIHEYTKPYVYVDNGTTFEHVAILEPFGFTEDFDVSGRTAVLSTDELGFRYVQVYTLPDPITPPRALAFDFEKSTDESAWTEPADAYARTLAKLDNGKQQYVLRQYGSTTENPLVLNDSDWTGFQSIDADLTPTQVIGADRWLALAVRYADDRNYYAVQWRSGGTLQLVRREQGAYTVLAQTTLPMTLNQRQHIRLSVAGSILTVVVNGSQQLIQTDSRLKRGRAALIANRVLADFDNVYVAPTDLRNLAWKNWREAWFDWGRHFEITGGNWELTGEENPDGMSQTTTTGSAYGLVGSPTDEQSVESLARLDTFNGSASTVAWFGLIARHVDANNYYYLAVRSSNQLQIRKMVNGQVTVLAAAPFTAAPGAFRMLRFDVLGDQLHAYVDGVLVAQAIDGSLPRGRYGVGTYRTAATFQTFIVDQP